jgi:hypothetical protein
MQEACTVGALDTGQLHSKCQHFSRERARDMQTAGQPAIQNWCLDLIQSLLHVDRWADGATCGS